MEENTFWILKHRKAILWTYVVITCIAALSLLKIQFSFKFEQFFPKGDPDLEFFQEFTKDFESDDNFMLIALRTKESIFSKSYLDQVNAFSEACKGLPYVHNVQSLANLKVPSLTPPFGFSYRDFIRTAPDSLRVMDSMKIMSNPKYKDLISKEGDAMLLALKHIDNMTMGQSDTLMRAFETLIAKESFEDYHLLGRAYFQDELASMQQREIIVSTGVSIILVSIIFFLLYRQKYLILISLGTIALGMLVFVGGLSLFGREFNGISALYPVLMLIVGTSDVVHIVSKYVDLIIGGETKSDALRTTVKEIGLATFLTSITTAAGFLSLVTSRIGPIQEFGVNSAIGVVLAYLVVITFTLAAISLIPRDQIQQTKFQGYWNRMMEKFYWISKHKQPQILVITAVTLVVFAIGISKISTNYNIENNLPRGAKITTDFLYFESQFSGFRPFEFAVQLKDGHTAYEPEVIQELDKISEHLASYDEVGSVTSLSDFYRTIQGATQQDTNTGLPTDEMIVRLTPLVKNMANMGGAVLVNVDETKTRITSKINDKGADIVSEIGENIDQWIVSNIDTSLMSVKRTGTGVILDRNAEYVRTSLLQGMGLALIIVIIIMTLIFRDIRMLFISLVPNVLPLLFAAALLGYAGIKLEATISIIFTIVFGIAVDDTIHFLSKYKICLNKGMDKEEAILATFKDTGKAITFTTIILFFGFLVLLFSIHPPSNVIGVMMSITLISALIADFFVLPILLRKLM